MQASDGCLTPAVSDTFSRQTHALRRKWCQTPLVSDTPSREVCLDELVGVGGVGGCQRQPQGAAIQHMAAVGCGHGALRALLDEQDAEPALLDRGECFEDDVDDAR